MIFQDSTKRRWKLTLKIFISLMIIISMFIGLNIYKIVKYPPIPSLSKIDMETVQKNTESLSKKENRGNIQKNIPIYSKDSFVHSIFISQNDENSINVMKQHIKDIDMIFPDWLIFNGDNDEIKVKIDSSLLSYLKENNVMVLPRITNTDADGQWAGSNFCNYISTSQNRSKLSNEILKVLKEYDLKGINLDFEALDPSSRVDYLDFLTELKDLLHKNNMYLTIDLPMKDVAFDYELIGNICDNVIVMAYDEHYPSGENGAIAGQDWFDDGIEDIVKSIPKEKLIVAMGQYSYDWNITKKTTARSLGFDETMNLASEFDVDIQTDKISTNSTFSYKEANGDEHKVWILDGISLWNEMQFLKDIGVYGVSLWRAGLEDSVVWNFYTMDNLSSVNPKILEHVTNLNAPNYYGNGEILKVQSLPHEGKRELDLDKNLITYANYSVLPTGYQVERYGHSDNRSVVLTFDDGPDPVYTNEILDVLKKYNINATFFVVGEQMNRFPEVVKREANEGNIVGSHTYYHPRIPEVSDNRLRLELNGVQQLSKEILGKEMVLFRSPYDTDSSPTSSENLNPFYTAGQLGYTIVNADIDSNDYERPGVDEIVNSVNKQLKETGSNIILMHDAGGDREETVEALEKLIPLLKDEGYKFVNINDLLGVPKISLMGNVGFKDKILQWISTLDILIKKYLWNLIIGLFFVSTLISIFRIVFLGFFVIKSRIKRNKDINTEKFQPFVTVLVPAYNEELVIEKTLKSLMKSKYKSFEVLVIDDGSLDDTSTIVENLSLSNPKVRLITKINGGKFSALNLGFEEARADYVITIDADTIILPDTIKNLINPFIDPSVDAVCGNVRVGNVKNILTGFQAVEYITTQNYDRRAFDSLNCISVVPGATGAWKKEAVLNCGGYSDLTLTEDADLTLTMLKGGSKIVYAADAISITEAPETAKDLFKQRFRWSFGTYQCLWKHKKSFFNGNLGWIALPNMFLFQLLLPILAPIGDLVFIFSLFRGDMKAVFSGYLIFLLIDFIGSSIAFLIDKAPLKYMLFIFIQRFYYRQFMYLVTFKTIISSIKGGSHGWNKLKRTSSINVKDIAVDR